MKATLKLIVLFAFSTCLLSQAQSESATRWQLTDDEGIEWIVKQNDTHKDNIEMSGLYTSSIVHYGIKEGILEQNVHLIFPMLRTIPNKTRGHLSRKINYKDLGQTKINGKEVIIKPTKFTIKGILGYELTTADGGVIKHQLFPSTDKPLFIDKVEISNPTKQPLKVELPKVEWSFTSKEEKGVYGAYTIKVVSDKQGEFTLMPNETLDYGIIYSGRLTDAVEPYVSPNFELKKREKLVEDTFSDLVFESPDEVMNRTFAFAKLRAVESIFDTKGGLMHAPGGGSYYAAIWANDQAEYVNPFFPFLGNLTGNESAMNSFRHFARYMNPEYKRIPSSIIAEGIDKWNGAGDRGDMAMIAYGAARYALASGNIKDAQELWPLIEWCLEYCKRKINEDGVVSSDSDELEGRFPAGKANLNTSSLYYDALISSVYLGKELNIDTSVLKTYTKQSKEIKNTIESYFGRNVAGFETYRYYKGNDILRAWICTPLTVDIFTRTEGTVDALFSDKLWTEDGLATASGKPTFWDRSTLYALRGVFAAGLTKRAMPFLSYYSERRLLGEHVPYAVEAYPEGNQRHLSAESGLYCRIMTEGIFGIRPVGLNSFTLSPKLPENWDSMALRNVKSFNQTFDIEINRDNDKLSVKITNENEVVLDTKMKNGAIINVQF